MQIRLPGQRLGRLLRLGSRQRLAVLFAGLFFLPALLLGLFFGLSAGFLRLLFGLFGGPVPLAVRGGRGGRYRSRSGSAVFGDAGLRHGLACRAGLLRRSLRAFGALRFLGLLLLPAEEPAEEVGDGPADALEEVADGDQHADEPAALLFGRLLRDLRRVGILSRLLRRRIQALFQGFGVPLQIVADDGEDPVEIAAHGLQKADVQLAVLQDVDAAAFLAAVEAVAQRHLRLARRHRTDEALVLCEEGAEDLVEEEGHGAVDLRGGIQGRGQLDAKHLLVAVFPHGDAVDLHKMAVGKVVVVRQLPEGAGLHLEVGKLPGDLHAGDIQPVAHGLRIAAERQRVAANLAVAGPSVDVVGRTAHQDPAVGGGPEHLVVLAAQGEELAGQVFLEDLAPELGAQVELFALLVLGDVAGVLQVGDDGPDELFIADVIGVFHLAGLDAVLPLQLHQILGEADGRTLDLEDHTLLALAGAGDVLGVEAGAEGVPEAVQRLVRIQAHQQHLAADLIL